MKLNQEERIVLFKAVKIIQHGEELSGIDIDVEMVNALANKLQQEINPKSVRKVNAEIISLLKEVRGADS
ncbi:hypothetical protein HZC30_06025 [Candidatus Woesearchaeota archaeon]|nr:hypothetical protein [Candidatus Woesearchaeota archaeon]